MDRVRFQLDEHITHAVADALRRRGIDVLTVSEAGLRGAEDVEVLERSRVAERVVVTNDRDFLGLHQGQQQHAGIAFCEQGTRGIGQIVASLVLIYEVLEPGEMVGRIECL